MSGAGGSDHRAVPAELAGEAAAGARADPAHRAYRNPPTPQARHTGCTERPETLILSRAPAGIAVSAPLRMHHQEQARAPAAKTAVEMRPGRAEPNAVPLGQVDRRAGGTGAESAAGDD